MGYRVIPGLEKVHLGVKFVLELNFDDVLTRPLKCGGLPAGEPRNVNTAE